jgi:uncharacterized SAM-binding protein YcdF (DUF218 family)
VYTYFVWHVLKPLPIFFIWIGIAIAWLWYRRRETRKCLLVVTIPYVLLFVFSMPAVAYLLRGSLEWKYPRLYILPENTDAIVVLSGNYFPVDGGRTIPELDEDTESRCLYAWQLYRQHKRCPIVMSGGPDPELTGRPACAQVMRDFMVKLGVDPKDVSTESRSGTTYENARETRTLLEQNHFHKIALVTSTYHLPRSVACFRKQGIETIPCGCQFRATGGEDSRYGFLPSAGALQESGRAWHEWLGMAYYWLRGRI